LAFLRTRDGKRGWNRPLRSHVDCVLIAVDRESSASISTDLARALAAAQAAASAPLPQGPRAAQNRFTTLLKDAWTKIEGAPPDDAALGEILKSITVLTFDLDRPDRTSAQETLSRVIRNTQHAGAAFSVLVRQCEELMRGQLGMDAAGFRRALASAGIAAEAAPSFVADVAQLRRYSDDVQRHLNQYEETRVGSDEIRIDRACTEAVKRAVLDDSLLLVGEPARERAP
jgi:hypothetical protein